MIETFKLPKQKNIYNYWSQAIQKAREDTSRIPVLAGISPSEADPPRAVDQDEVQAVNHLILTKDTFNKDSC